MNDTQKQGLSWLMYKYGLTFELDSAFNQISNWENATQRNKKSYSHFFVNCNGTEIKTLQNVESFLLAINPHWQASDLVAYKGKFISLSYDMETEGSSPSVYLSLKLEEVVKSYLHSIG